MIKTDSIVFAYAVEVFSLYFLSGFLAWLAYELIMSGKDGYGWMIAGAIVAFFSASTTCIKREKK